MHKKVLVTPAARKPMDAFSSIVMLVLSMIWGFQQVAIKMGAIDMSSTLQVGLRSLAAAVLIVLVMVYQRQSLSMRDGTLGPGLWAGLLFGGEFMSVSYGLNWTTAGHIAVFVYTAPVFAALGLHCLIPEERLRPLQWVGLGLSVVGIGIAFSPSLLAPGGSHEMLWGDLLGLLGGASWAATTLVIRKTRLSETPATKTLWYQLMGAGIMLLVVSTGDWSQVKWTGALWVNLAFQTFVIAFGSFLAWFALLRKYLASRLSAFSFLTPIWGVAFGVIFLREALDASFVIGAVFVLAGISLVSRK